jgi:hypothetical protein
MALGSIIATAANHQFKWHQRGRSPVERRRLDERYIIMMESVGSRSWAIAAAKVQYSSSFSLPVIGAGPQDFLTAADVPPVTLCHRTRQRVQRQAGGTSGLTLGLAVDGR